MTDDGYKSGENYILLDWLHDSFYNFLPKRYHKHTFPITSIFLFHRTLPPFLRANSNLIRLLQLSLNDPQLFPNSYSIGIQKGRTKYQHINNFPRCFIKFEHKLSYTISDAYNTYDGFLFGHLTRQFQLTLNCVGQK